MNKEYLIETKDLVRRYPNGNVLAVDHVSIGIKEKEILGIMGPSGSGKSTLLHLIGGLDRPTSGQVLFDDAPLHRLLGQDRFRIKNIGFVFQAFYLWPNLNVIENILLPLMEADLKGKEKINRAKNMIKVMGLEHRVKAAVKRLSMGERQRVAIARSLVMKPRILLADEPTGNLDSHNTEQIMKLFQKIREEQSTTIVIVTHEHAVKDFVDRTIHILDGKLQKSGN
jgi:ABC-type lipoprotein export system ATPase subunit